MRPGDGQLSLFEVDTIDQSQSAPAVPPPAPAPTGFDEAVQAEPETRTASHTPEAEAGRRPPRTRPGTDPGDSASPTRAPERRPRRAPVSEPLLSPEDVARWCGLSRKAVYRAVARGELRAARILSRLRIDPSDVEAWLRASIVDPDGPAPVPVPARLPSSTGLRRLLPEP